jgi:alpha-galactosidase
MPRIAFIGAGSTVFTRNLVGDLLSLPELRESTAFALMDIDPERLAASEDVVRRLAAARGVPARVEATLDRRAALDGADYVVTSFQVGGLDATLKDFEVPKRFGLRQTIADTLGVGGIFRGLRTFPFLDALATDMLAVCPEAWLLNYTNPMAMLVWATYAGTPLQRVVGLCPSLRNTAVELAELVGVPFSRVTWQGAGINHQAWVTRLECDGEDLLPRVRAACAADPEGLGRRARAELFRRLGAYPSESSEHTVETVPFFLPHSGEVERFRVPVGEYLQRSLRTLDEVAETGRRLAEGEPLELDDWPEDATAIIHSIVTGTVRTVHASVRNDGLITNLPDGCCVEVPCLVDRAGVQPTHVGDLPPQLAALNRRFASVCELTVRAALEGRHDLITQAALIDPTTSATLAPAQIVSLIDELAPSISP